MYDIILASASPRRQELLKQIGVSFQVIPSTQDEDAKETHPGKLVESLSAQKAISVASGLTKECIVIGADTVVALDEQILGKPKDEMHAYKMIDALQGRKHSVYSGVTLVRRSPDAILDAHTFHVETAVSVLPMTETQIRDYIATGEPMDKAGAYGIQGYFARYIEGITGDYYNVVGLPLSKLMTELDKCMHS